MALKSLALLSVHTSPLARLGGDKTGGMNVYVRELARELGTRGIQVDIYTRRYSPDLPEVDTSLGKNVRVIYIMAGPENVLNPADVYAHISQFTAGVIAFTTRHDVRYDLIYSHYYLSGLVANKLKEVWGTPFVQMFHTLGHMKNRIVPGQVGASPSDMRVAAETRLVRWADHLIAATPAELAQLRWLYRADRRKISVIPPGVDTKRFHPIPITQAKARIGIAPEDNILLFVGRLEPLKAVDSILEALHHIQQMKPASLSRTRLIVIGGDPHDLADGELSRLKSMTHQLGLAKVVEFIGAKDQDWLRNYYAASLAVIMPSDYESFGLVALEAMAVGTPVIASQVGGLAFLVRDSETGFLVPVREPVVLAERILSLLENPEQREKMGAAAAHLAQRYTWSAIADQLLPVFENLVRPPALQAYPP